MSTASPRRSRGEVPWARARIATAPSTHAVTSTQCTVEKGVKLAAGTTTSGMDPSFPGYPWSMGSLTFVGTATTVLRVGGFTLLTDPNFLHQGQRAYLGKGLWSRRLTEPAMGIADLPDLDLVLLSHLHGDHFDRVARQGLDRDVEVLTTPHAAVRLDRWGFRTRALSTWRSHHLERGEDTLELTAVPAVHARGVMGRLLPPVMGTFLVHRRRGQVVRSIYVSGDTLTGAHLDEVVERCGRPDVAVVHLGGTRVLLHTVTMDDRQGVDFLRRVEPRTAIGVHHDDYGVFRSPVSAWVQRASGAGLSPRLVVPSRGETIDLD